MRQVVIRRTQPARVRRGLRGLGQYYPNTPAAPSLPACATPDMAQTVPQSILIAGGGLATLVGVVGAIFSDQYRKDFAIAAGAGMVSSFIGGIWAAASIQSMYNQCGGAQGVAAILDQQAQPPTVAAPTTAQPTPA